MQFRVTVPAGIKGGQVVTVNAAGTQFNVRVPKEVTAGDTFLFSLTPEQVAAAKSTSATSSSKRNSNKSNTADSVAYDNTTLLEGTKASSASAVVFHDYTDLGMALCLGFAIGGAIVFGFVLGVLFVTDALPPNVSR